jgi:hypothetical protein
MTKDPDNELMFFTVSMAEILLSQNLVTETAKVVARLRKIDPANPRVAALAKRLEEVNRAGGSDAVPIKARGEDYAELELRNGPLLLRWELTREGLAIAKATARFSGSRVFRLFTAQPGPRGVRTGSRDIVLEHTSGEMLCHGLPDSAVHVGAVGYLANTGVFVPLARSEPCVVRP